MQSETYRGGLARDTVRNSIIDLFMWSPYNFILFECTADEASDC
jgi:hypothetical protein